MFAILAFIGLLNASHIGIDCECYGYTEKYWPIEKQVKVDRKHAKALFSGKVQSIVETQNKNGHFLEVRFKVLRSWKNIDSNTVTVITSYPSPGGCGYAFLSGRSYLVYIDRVDEGKLRTSICSRTMLL